MKWTTEIPQFQITHRIGESVYAEKTADIPQLSIGQKVVENIAVLK